MSFRIASSVARMNMGRAGRKLRLLRFPKTRPHTASILAAFLLVAALCFSAQQTVAGDSIYGKIIAIKTADVVVLDYGGGTYDVRIVGIDAPKEGARAAEAKKLTNDLVLGKNVRLRLEGRADNGEFIGQLTTDDPVTGIKDIGIELLETGLVQRLVRYDYKYGELSAAENKAKQAKRGLWAPAPQ
jgi:endonuclease YncB( thermonuclease family)